jgi:hypothetical protein
MGIAISQVLLRVSCPEDETEPKPKPCLRRLLLLLFRLLPGERASVSRGIVITTPLTRRERHRGKPNEVGSLEISPRRGNSKPSLSPVLTSSLSLLVWSGWLRTGTVPRRMGSIGLACPGRLLITYFAARAPDDTGRVGGLSARFPCNDHI